jgi:hypothetical protein
MLRKTLISGLAALSVAVGLAGNPAAAETAEPRTDLASRASSQAFRLGPYATIRRAWEVANYYRSLGYRTSAPFHNGDGYYVDVYVEYVRDGGDQSVP